MIESIITIDRQVLLMLNGSNSLFWDSFVPVLTSGITWIPLYIALCYLVIKNNDTMEQIVLTMGAAVLCIILSGGIDDIVIKPWVSRIRPCNDPIISDGLNLIHGQIEAGYSFFSAHAANTMSLAVFFCLLVRGRLFNTVILCWSLLNGWTRLYLGVHYPSDVLFGFLYGCLVGVVVYSAFHRFYFKMSPKLNYISTQYTKSGYDRKDIDMVVTILMATLSVAIFYSILDIGL